MQKRSVGVTTLAFGSIMVALYGQFAAVSLILTGALWSPSGSIYATISYALGVVFAVLVVASYFLAYGYWTRKHWAWAGGVAQFVTLVVASVILSLVSTNFTSTVLPLAAAVAGIWFLNRPATRVELLGTTAPEAEAAAIPAGLEVAKPVH